ncbi:MAG: hypothetical protein EAX96_09670 [Candidatus Lokiarchaeota archaeon]|nr:hypothetical protein [Candidatus Lokiarchaeota archaeon]
MVMIDFFSKILRRLFITDKELDLIQNLSANSPIKSEKIQNVLVNSLKKYFNMYFDDFFQVRSFTDEEYRKVLGEIANEMKKNPETTEFQIENLKQFQNFSKAMQKAIFKVVKEESL